MDKAEGVTIVHAARWEVRRPSATSQNGLTPLIVTKRMRCFMDIVAIINYKGGVGKTTVTANLAGELAFRGKKVLLIDMDAQSSLTFSFVTPDDWNARLAAETTIKSWFDAIGQGKEPPPLTDFVTKPVEVNRWLAAHDSLGSIDLIASHLGLINVDLELATLLSAANLQQAKRNYIKVHGKLREALSKLADEGDYDIVLIDCPPNFNIVTKNALVASEGILIPAKPDYLSTLGIDYLQRSVRQLVDEYNEYVRMDSDGADDEMDEIDPKVLGVLFTMIQITSGEPIAAQRQFISATRRLGMPTLKNYFRENKTIFGDAPRGLLPVVLHAYGNATHAGIVEEIEKVVTEFETLL